MMPALSLLREEPQPTPLLLVLHFPLGQVHCNSVAFHHQDSQDISQPSILPGAGQDLQPSSPQNMENI